MKNNDQIEYWNGPAGERWRINQHRLDRGIRPFGLAAIDRLQVGPGDRVLDVGCGCGDTTLDLAGRVGRSGFVCGVDISAPMLARARERITDGDPVELRLADASIIDFVGSFDAVFSRFGVMFFAEPAAAFANLRRALVAGGRLAFVCWRALGENPWCTVPLRAVSEILPDPAPRFDGDEPGPFALADAARITRILTDAGFERIDIRSFDGEWLFSDTGIDDAVDVAMIAGPAARMLADASDAQRALARQRLRDELSLARRGDRIELPGAAWIVHARN